MKIAGNQNPFLPKPVDKTPEEKLRQVADLYEKQFMREMLKSMRSTVGESGLVKTNQAEKIFRDQLDDEYVNQWNQKGGLGLSDLIYDQLVEKYGAQMGINKNKLEKPIGPVQLSAIDQFKISRMPNPAGDQKSIQYRIEINPQSIIGSTKDQVQSPLAVDSEETSAANEVLAPWGGKIVRKLMTQADEQAIEISHDNGLVSRLNFRGQTGLNEGDTIEPGQKIGLLDENSKMFFWNIQNGTKVVSE